jgi:hypothetical protein
MAMLSRRGLGDSFRPVPSPGEGFVSPEGMFSMVILDSNGRVDYGPETHVPQSLLTQLGLDNSCPTACDVVMSTGKCTGTRIISTPGPTPTIDYNGNSVMANVASKCTCVPQCGAHLSATQASQLEGALMSLQPTPSSSLSTTASGTPTTAASSTCKMSILPKLNICDTYIFIGGAVVGLFVMVGLMSGNPPARR